MNKTYPFRSPWNDHIPDKQKFTQPSQTVPDQAMSIGEIMKRFVSGLPVGGGRVPFYEEEDGDDIEDTMPMGMDKIERIEWIRSNKNKIDQLKSELNSINEQQARSQAAEIKSKSLKTPPEGEK